ncbi:MAG TPA: class I SAM-dependent methyltransferase [Candidatus Saccharimonadales bacterium]|nr:class I SAM-dependent methyltransferase [Candidatus Saccharimonadales bacterium]
MIDRAPVSETGVSIEGASKAMQDSQTTWDVVTAHLAKVTEQLGIGKPDQFVVDEDALLARINQLDKAKAGSHIVSRGSHQLAINLHSNTSKIEGEFGKRRTLDIGCGEGRLGTDLERKAKTPFIFMDRDADTLASIHTRRGSKVVGEALRLPFEDGQFERTIGMYAAHIWTVDPVDSLAELLEQLRVTREGGSAICVPLVTQIIKRQKYLGSRDADKLRGRESTVAQLQEDMAMKVWDMRDYLVISALRSLVEENYLDMTWTSFLGEGITSGAGLEVYSTILDVKNPIGRDVISGLISGAEEVAYSKDASTLGIVERVLDLPNSELGSIAEDHEIWEGGAEGVGFKVTRHNLPGTDTPFIIMSVSGIEPAMTNLIARFTRALGDYSSIELGGSVDNPTMVTWVLDPETEKLLFN